MFFFFIGQNKFSVIMEDMNTYVILEGWEAIGRLHNTVSTLICRTGDNFRYLGFDPLNNGSKIDFHC
jgi:hypothetical protein